MILGLDEVKRLGLIENLSDREIENPEGCGIDVRIGKLYGMTDSEGYLFSDKRKTPDYDLLAEFKDGKGEKVFLEPGKIYVGETVEIIKTPLNLFGRFHPRHTLFKSGILVLGQKADPGYNGAFTFVLINLSEKRFQIEMGARVAQMVFHEVKGKTSPYRGQWQGGRAFIKKEEKQI